MIDLVKHLSSLDHGQIADLVGDARVIELVDAVMRQRGEALERGQILLHAIGGPVGLLEDRRRRRQLMISLEPKEEEELRTALGVADLYSFRLSERRRLSLYEAFGLKAPPHREHRAIPAVRGVRVHYGLFEHQTAALLDCVRYLEGQPHRVLLHMPTGSGKTRTAMHLVCRHLNARRSGVVVWLVSGLELCDQAAREFERAWSILGERPLAVVRVWPACESVDLASFEIASTESGRPLSPEKFAKELWPIDLEDAIVLASLDSINPLIDQWEPHELLARQKRVSMVVFDEAHRAVAPTYRRAIECLVGSCGLLGLSATPGRRHHGDDDDEDQELVRMFGQNKVVLQIPGFNSPVEGLIDQGYLARLQREELQIASSTLTSDELMRVREKLSKSLDLDESELRAFGLDATRNLQIVARVEQLVLDGNHRRVIVFAPSVASSDLLASLLVARGVSAASVTSATPSTEREEAVSAYRASDDTARVLCNYGVFTTGFDAPSTSAVVIARPTNSIVLLSQMAGRAIRGPKVGGNSEATLVTVVDMTIPELIDIVEQFHAFDESWAVSTGADGAGG